MSLNLLPKNAMTFGDNQHGNVILEKLQQQREKNRCCDVILYVSGVQFHAHRCILSACSPFFDSLLKASKTVKEQLTISADSSEVFYTLLSYMYTGTVIIDKENVSELLKLANKFILSKLKKYCAEYLLRYLDTNNCLTVFEMSNKYGLESLQKSAINLISMSENLSIIIKGEEILNLSLSRMENFLSNSNWKISNEDILVLVSSWVNHNLEERESMYRTLLTWVSWQNVDAEKVVQHILDHNLFEKSQKCRTFILEILDENSLLYHPTYEPLNKLKSEQIENSEEEGEKFLNLAISTAIDETLVNEPAVDKYLMDTGKELLRAKFHQPPRQLYLEKDPNLFKNDYLYQDYPNKNYDLPPLDRGSIDFSSNYSEFIEKNANFYQEKNLSEDLNISTFSNPHNFDISLDDFCKYNVDNTFKNKYNYAHTFEESVPREKTLYHSNVALDCHYYREKEDMQITELPKNMLKEEQLITNQNHLEYCDENLPDRYSNFEFSHLPYNKISDCATDKEESMLKGTFKYDNSNREFLESVPQLSFDKAERPINEQYSNHENDRSNNEQFLNHGNDCREKGGPFVEQNPYVNKSSMMELGHGNFIPDKRHLNYENNTSLQEYNREIFEPNRFHEFSNNQSDSLQKNINYIHEPAVRQENENLLYNLPCMKNSENSANLESNLQTSIDLNMTKSVSDASNSAQNVFYEDILKTSENNCEKSAPKNVIDCSVSMPKSPKLLTRKFKNKMIEESKNIDYSVKEVESNTKVINEKTSGLASDILDLNSTMLENNENHSRNVKNGQSKNLTKSYNSFESGISRGKSSEKENVQIFETRKLEKDQTNKLKETEKRKVEKIVNNEINEVDDAVECSVCSEKFSKTNNILFNHMKTHFKGPDYSCDICDKSGIRSFSHFLGHRQIHFDDKPFECPQCHFKTKRKGNLKEHMKVHGVGVGTAFKCDECDASYSTERRLKVHKAKHTDAREFVCKICNWSGKTSNTLLVHSKIHSGKLFNCQYPDCAYQTTKASHLKDHMLFHTKSRQFSCETCCQTFVTKSLLLRHQTVHKNTSSHQCSFCSYSTNRSDALKRHVQRKHQTKKSAAISTHRNIELKKSDAVVQNSMKSQLCNGEDSDDDSDD